MLLNHPTSTGALTSLALCAGQAWDKERRTGTTEGPFHRGVPGGGGERWSKGQLSLSHPRPRPAQS